MKQAIAPLLPLALLSGCQQATQPAHTGPDSTQATQPNIIYILADDLGYGDVSCFGQQKFTTPNIDRLAAEGMKLTAHFAGCTVCAPSRASLMTGKHTGHQPIRGNQEVKPEGQLPIPDSLITIAEVLKKAGYATGAFGKWGIGYPGSEGDPNNQGFDEFYGYNCQRYAHRYYPPHIWHNQTKVPLANDGTNQAVFIQDSIHNRALSFIKNHKDEPFFVYLPYVAPHAELIAPNDSILAKFKGRWPETPFTTGNDYGPDFRIGGYANQAIPKATFAAMVYRLDVYVGQIVSTLKEAGIDKNTLIIFTSDNGPHKEAGADPEFFNSNGPWRGFKRDLYDGGLRVPTIAWWPGHIKAGSQSGQMTAFWDMMPTFAQLSGANTQPATDGTSLLPVLLGQQQSINRQPLYWEFHGWVNGQKGKSRAVRTEQYKLIEFVLNQGDSTHLELYDLVANPTETQNIAKENPQLTDSLYTILVNQHSPSKRYPF